MKFFNIEKQQLIPIVIVTIVLILAIIYLVFNIESTINTLKQSWQTIVELINDPEKLKGLIPALNVIIPIVFLPLLFWKFKRFRNWITRTIGEERSVTRHWTRYILPVVLAFPFISFTLLGGVSSSIPPVLEFSIVAIAPILGGLVLTASGNKGLRRYTQNELIAVAQKMIVATILLIIFVALTFSIDLLDGINVSALSWSVDGFIRWFTFWVGIWSFFLGLTLFLLGISDLVLALQHLRR